MASYSRLFMVTFSFTTLTPEERVTGMSLYHLVFLGVSTKLGQDGVKIDAVRPESFFRGFRVFGVLLFGIILLFFACFIKFLYNSLTQGR